MFFAYGEKEITYLKQKDKRLAEIIDKIGMIEREVDTDLFSAVVAGAAVVVGSAAFPPPHAVRLSAMVHANNSASLFFIIKPLLSFLVIPS